MKLIGIDANEANVASRVGSNEYAFQVLHQLYKQDKTNHYLVYLSKPPLKDLPLPRPGWQYRVLSPAFFWTQWRLPLDLYFHSPRPDLFFTLGHYAPRFSPVKTVICVMDLAYLFFPDTYLKKDLYKLKSWTNYSARKAAHIITISKHSQADLVKHYHLNKANITVAYPATKPLNFSKPAPVKGKYLLYLGTLQPRKNITNLLTAFSSLSPSQPKLKLVLAGKIGWKFTPQKQPGVTYLGFVPETQLGNLIKNASALILPSFYEGFGIPVVQALSVGTPVIVAKNSSLTEIAGNYGHYINSPFSPQEIKQGIIEAQAAKKKPVWRNPYSWSKTGQIILNTLNQL